MAVSKAFSASYTKVECQPPTEHNAASPPTRRPAWFVGVVIGLGLIVATLIINIGILAWIQTTFEVNSDGIATIYQGSCSKTTSLMLVSHLVINIISTILLAVSNNCAQLLISPTRGNVDKAHARGRWLHISFASIRNFRWISWWRIFSWALLLLSSLPLHLVYNSVFYSTTYAEDYLAAAVTSDFITGKPFNSSLDEPLFDSGNISSVKYSELLHGMQDHTGSLQKLDATTCVKQYLAPIEQAAHHNVLFVTNYTYESPLLTGYVGTIAGGSDDFLYWIDGRWSFDVSTCPQINTSSSGPRIYLPGIMYWSGLGCPPTANIEYCLAEPGLDLCTVGASTRLLLAVIVCNALKGVCLLVTLLTWRTDPLAVVGDAIASFLTTPDPTTQGLGTLAWADATLMEMERVARNKLFLDHHRSRSQHTRRWMGMKRRYGHVLSDSMDMLSFFMMLVFWLGLLTATATLWNKTALGQGFANQNVEAGAKQIGDINTESIGRSLASNILLVNTPQVAVSFVYVLYNTHLTRMLASAEISHFAEERQGLRVSRPSGEQRSTYWLQLPYSHSVPLLVVMALIHWLISRGIFLLNVMVYDIDGNKLPGEAKYTWGVSSLALLLALVLVGVLIASLVAMMWRKLGVGMPILSTCTLAISAACHPPDGCKDPATKLLMYGATPETELAGGNEPRRRRVPHATLSSSEVEPLVVGVEYDAILRSGES